MAKKFSRQMFILMAVALVLFGCKKAEQSLAPAMESIQAEELAKNVQILASDEFEGRGINSVGEEKTINFLREEFEKLGLKPGNGQSFFQEVPVVRIAADPDTRLTIASEKRSSFLSYGDEFVALTLRVVPEVSLRNSELVFVGYGIVAPEYNWNDYQGIDVHGKTVVMLINDPGFATNDLQLFKGKAMTYYGRWTYKYEEAARQGAAGALIIHETEPAAYGWDVVRTGWTGSKFNLVSDDNNLSRCAVEGWLHLNAAHKIFDMARKDFEQLKASAAKRGFKAIPLDLKASLTLKNSIENLKTRNVIAISPGSKRADEYIFYTAHWDHFGINPNLQGDKIFNGAADNATGTAALIELAKAFKNLKSPPGRSIAFLSTTGEEQGLIGAQYYATHPIFPTTKTVAVINMDILDVYGPMKDITVIGYGNSELDDYVEAAAAEQGRRARPDPKPENGSYFRADHFAFAKEGIPAIYVTSGVDHVKYGEAWTLEKMDKFVAERYHKPSDEYDPNWDLSGAIEDLRLLFKVGYRLAMESSFPNWRPGFVYKAKRDAAMAAAAK
jgi:Zn-dependent M28 family amino/carboxypeptidase